jgi:hypothetical protein
LLATAEVCHYALWKTAYALWKTFGNPVENLIMPWGMNAWVIRITTTPQNQQRLSIGVVMSRKLDEFSVTLAVEHPGFEAG